MRVDDNMWRSYSKKTNKQAKKFQTKPKYNGTLSVGLLFVRETILYIHHKT